MVGPDASAVPQLRGVDNNRDLPQEEGSRRVPHSRDVSHFDGAASVPD